MFYEEYDIGYRAIEKGYDLIHAHKATVNHRRESSSKPSLKVYYIKVLHFSRSKRIFLNKFNIKKDYLYSRFIGFVTNFMIAILMLITMQPKRFIKYIARTHANLY